MVPHPRFADLAARVRRCPVLDWSAGFIRCAGYDYANAYDLLSGEGSLQHGGRFNVRDGFRATYGSLEVLTATAEKVAAYRDQGVPDPELGIYPLVMAAVRASGRLLDLTDPRVRRLLGVSLRLLTSEGWEDEQEAGREGLTQALGRAARDAGHHGLLFPSAAHPGGHNVILFPDRLPPGALRVVNADKLPTKKT